MQSINMEERRARIALEEQCRLLGNICKKLNQDIEAYKFFTIDLFFNKIDFLIA